MTDLELTRLCAEAMGYDWHGQIGGRTICVPGDYGYVLYLPLRDDEQVMALVKKFHLRIDHNETENWSVCKDHGFTMPPEQGWNPDLNRAIVECVAKMQAAKK